MRHLFAALVLGALFAPAVKAERWVTYGDFLEALYPPEYVQKELAAGRCRYNQVDLDSVTKRRGIATFNDRLFRCESPESSDLDIGARVNCRTGQNWIRSTNSWSKPISTFQVGRATYLRRLELVCQ